MELKDYLLYLYTLKGYLSASYKASEMNEYSHALKDKILTTIPPVKIYYRDKPCSLSFSGFNFVIKADIDKKRRREVKKLREDSPYAKVYRYHDDCETGYIKKEYLITIMYGYYNSIDNAIEYSIKELYDEYSLSLKFEEQMLYLNDRITASMMDVLTQVAMEARLKAGVKNGT